ncbi:MAG: glycoside hydrolase family 16 protein, partial [Woeseiaceae bacterium]|nr:glycoside hydrolase family 16 protein [Woeseiaceae bacterium]
MLAIWLCSACSDSNETGSVLSGVGIFSGEYARPALNTRAGVTVYDNIEVTPGGTLNLVWSEEFDGTELDPATWFYQLGDGTEYGIPGWGNNELQYYRAENAVLEDGVLKITAQQESVAGYNYTSARITTADRVAFRYGRIEARMKLPGGQGLWPAFWMLAQDSPYGNWAASGEIDIMEAINLGAAGGDSVFGTLHYGGEFPNNVFSGDGTSVGSDPTADFHNYAIEWDADEFRWYVDDELYAMQNNWYSDAGLTSSSGAYPAPFNQAFHILLNVAVGGNLPGSPNA